MAEVLLLGAKGRLGAALAREWARTGHAVRALARPEVDVADADSLARALDAGPWTVVANCTGITSLEACEDDPALARKVNHEAPGYMARAAAARGAICLHFSTDYVFDGSGTRPLVESDDVRPLSVYGRTKYDGELAVLEASARNLVFRVSWVFGPDKPSFVDAILARARESDRVEAIADKYSCPTHTLDAAGWIEPFLGGGLPGGIYHACNAGACSWRELGQEALRIAAGLGWPLAATDVEPIRLADMRAFRAARPVFTPMDCGRLAAATGMRPRPWQEALADYIGSVPGG